MQYLAGALSDFVIISLRKRALVALLYWSFLLYHNGTHKNSLNHSANSLSLVY